MPKTRPDVRAATNDLVACAAVTAKIRVCIVDDHPMMRDGIAATLREAADFDVVGVGATADDAISLAAAQQPDVMLVDIHMPGGGLTAVQHVAQHWPNIACVVLTSNEDGASVGQALRVGARGYVLKGVSGQDLARTLRSIRRGELYITPTLAKALLIGMASPSNDSRNPDSLRSLNKRESDILQLIAQGLINKQIGFQLGLTEKTVKHYVTNILQKLKVTNRVEAALIAQQCERAKATSSV